MIHSEKRQKKLLIFSLYGAVGFAIVGIILGVIIDSQMILFDGLYSLISVGLSGMSLYATSFMYKNDWKRYPFGKTIVEPLVIIIKYMIILFLVMGSLISAVVTLFQGGRVIVIETAVLYSVVGTVVCYGFYYYINKFSKKNGSGITQAEANQWLMDTLVSLGVLVGFLIAFILQGLSKFETIIPFIDPIMVIVIAIYFIKVPVKEIRLALRELLKMSPEGKLSKSINGIVGTIEKKYFFQESFLRVSKSQKMLWIEIDFVVQKESRIQTIKDQDTIREEINKEINKLGYDQWLTVSFTNDRKWAL
ncbi:cation diffusion facilitator family transporter [Natranaerovirga hydrolytica]|uniref:Cation diffusion facilitator family transporter n=1 Tax=Natranaerovirga hydrolytica TaxID=680378 RepID=A0A4R1MQA8_9FIRM|nr:cation diffusion facilitator family transporter [Natranaerovirga hydrolytica]TCK92709.1 cation diffusion facilitator family transporter [Natranaerovirga hydrolytica]